ncbi:MAG TPA: IclR family transcriptional regulator [Anaerolineales bacterium]|nr:IclR family transcriptional regulator [Anaerolineales bacterium]
MTTPINETQSIHRAIAILDCFRDIQPQLGVREIARQLELHPSTVGRMLTTLTSLEILTQDKETHRYRMGSKVLKWSSVYISSVDLRVEARPYMEELHRATQETVHLDIPDGVTRICIERIESPHRLRWVARIGERMPYYASASGKVLLSFMPLEQQKAILKSTPLEKLTANTTTDPKVLSQELELIRKHGYAISEGERVEGVSCVAAPIFETAGKIIGAITISGPTARFSEQKIKEYAKLLMRATVQLSTSMGHLSEEIK